MEENKQQQDIPQQPVLDDEESVASAEDIAQYEREAAERRLASKNKKRPEEEDGVLAKEYDEMLSNNVDPYLEPDPSLLRLPYQESIFLSRGCSKCPKSYVPIKEHELRSCAKVGASNWMCDINRPCEAPFDVVEVRFKNNRKDFYRIPEGIDVNEGDLVAVEGQPGHDIGIVSLQGEACRIQMRRKRVNPESDSIKKLFRRAKPADIEKWVESLKDEASALGKTRKIAEELGLVMKVNDVEYQGDHSKAIFYYTADDRVDFRQLIKVLADVFHVRIEMKQIGVRQEAGKVGGIGTCGRELCCSTWLTNFKSVTTGVAKAQQILPNPQKLAGQCGKLKCCLNFEYEVYVDALKHFPPANTPIRFQKGLALYKKTDVFRGIMWYAYEGSNELYALKAESVKKIIEMNRNREYPEKMEDFVVELMSSSALTSEASEKEFEQELLRMAEGGNGVVEDMPQRHSQEAVRRNDRPRTNAQRVEHLERKRVQGETSDMQFETHTTPERRPHKGKGNRPKGKGPNNSNERRGPNNERKEHNGERRDQNSERKDRNNERRSHNNESKDSNK